MFREVNEHTYCGMVKIKIKQYIKLAISVSVPACVRACVHVCVCVWMCIGVYVCSGTRINALHIRAILTMTV